MTTTSWGESSAPVSGGSKDITRVNWKETTEIKARFIGGVLPRYAYWVTTKEGKKRSIECLSFNRATHSFDPNLQDPIKEVAPDILGPDAGKPQFSYVAQFIDRKTGKVTLFDPLKKKAYESIVSLARNPDYGDPTDELKGYDLVITKKKTGPLPQNVEYIVLPARGNSPLTAEEKELQLYDLDKLFKRPTYEEQKKWLIENTTYFMFDTGNEAEGAKDI